MAKKIMNFIYQSWQKLWNLSVECCSKSQIWTVMAKNHEFCQSVTGNCPEYHQSIMRRYPNFINRTWENRQILSVCLSWKNIQISSVWYEKMSWILSMQIDFSMTALKISMKIINLSWENILKLSNRSKKILIFTNQL